jgi:murein DD-endopeptidase MepM/ murein hydrolase activator NlpD
MYRRAPRARRHVVPAGAATLPVTAPTRTTFHVFPMPTGAAVSRGWSLDQGVDIAAPAHTPLLAVGSGVIVRHGISGFGPWAPVLRLDSGQLVYYGHAGPGKAVPVGTRVKAGQVIGEVGAGRVGISSGPHLEIGFAGPSGAPLGRGTAKTMLDNLLGATRQNPIDNPIGTATGAVPAALQAGADAAVNAAKEGALAALNALWGPVRDQAPKWLLIGALVIAGAALAVYGAMRTAGVQPPRTLPIPVPV